ncbi:putative endosomal integral membrane protein [Phaeomoniella chlamydospora]|uniref:Transmembrane 9 superfamily member n=1 Tax=Phaeomoniella chlamydospora TaxID=158046 RepID=A0A0G2E4U2_PHACM|nr:putative endosomal integral membrane protein [Phaeomoniella chlamydospora]
MHFSTSKSSTAQVALLALGLVNTASAFYLPGVAPTSYQLGEKVPLHVNALTPALSPQDEQLHSVFSFEYYHAALHFCRPAGGPKDVRESLGSIIFGDRIRTSPFELLMGKNETCKSLCEEKKFDQRSAKFVNRRIWENYNLNWLIDGLPAAQLNEDPQTGELFSSPGFPLGRINENRQVELNNHYDIIIDYHAAGIRGDQYRVVGVLVQPQSYKNSKNMDDGKAECPGDGSEALVLDENGETHVTWTYSVYWRPSKTAWATRWDKYLHVFDPKIHWFSLINSTIFVVFLVGMVSAILIRALRKDIARYNRLDSINLDDLSGTSAVVEDGVQEDSGWKLVHGDVFRAPRYPLLLSIFLGSGVQLFVMTGITVAFALFGFLSPSNRGFLATVILLLYTLFGFIGGYVSSRTYKTLGGERWKLNMALTPVVVPGIVFGIFFFMNLFVWAKGSSGAVPFTTMLAIVVIWFIISVPTSVTGSWIGFKHPAIETPTKTNQIPRQIPPPAMSLRPLPSLLLTGILPFGAIFVELYFIMTSLWTSKIYYMFGFLFVCYGLMIITCACTTILLVYFLLCAEDYRWQWRAFIGAGMTGGYVFLNALGFWATRVSFGGLTGAVLYVGYSALVSFLVFVLTGIYSPTSFR